MLTENEIEIECASCGVTRAEAADPVGGNIFACYCAEHCPRCMSDNTDVSEEYHPGMWICHGCGHSWHYVAPPTLS